MCRPGAELHVPCWRLAAPLSIKSHPKLRPSPALGQCGALLHHYARSMQAVREVLGNEALAAAQADGAALSQEQAIAEALEEFTPGAGDDGGYY
jgi:hypothetical protein